MEIEGPYADIIPPINIEWRDDDKFTFLWGRSEPVLVYYNEMLREFRILTDHDEATTDALYRWLKGALIEIEHALKEETNEESGD